MKFQVVLVPFPFDDLSQNKMRPAVCLTDVVGVHRHIVLAFITSALPASPEPSDVLLDSATTLGFSQTGLRVASALRLHRLMTVTASLIRRQLGVLPTNAQTEVQQKLKNLFGL